MPVVEFHDFMQKQGEKSFGVFIGLYTPPDSPQSVTVGLHHHSWAGEHSAFHCCLCELLSPRASAHPSPGIEPLPSHASTMSVQGYCLRCLNILYTLFFVLMWCSSTTACHRQRSLRPLDPAHWEVIQPLDCFVLSPALVLHPVKRRSVSTGPGAEEHGQSVHQPGNGGCGPSVACSSAFSLHHHPDQKQFYKILFCKKFNLVKFLCLSSHN